MSKQRSVRIGDGTDVPIDVSTTHVAVVVGTGDRRRADSSVPGGGRVTPMSWSNATLPGPERVSRTRVEGSGMYVSPGDVRASAVRCVKFGIGPETMLVTQAPS